MPAKKLVKKAPPKKAVAMSKANMGMDETPAQRRKRLEEEKKLKARR
jgi:hypothetical protein